MSIEQSQLVSALYSAMTADAPIRTQAEALLLEYAKKEPVSYFTSLVEIFSSVNEAHVVPIAGITIKNLIRSRESFEAIASSIPAESLQTVQRSILMRFGDAQLSPSTRKIAASIIISLVTKFAERDAANGPQGAVGFGFPQQQRRTTSWPGLFQQLLQVASDESQSVNLRAECIAIFGEVAPTLLPCTDYSSLIVPFTALIASALSSAKNEPWLAVKAAAATAALVVGSAFHAASAAVSFDRPTFDRALAPLVVQAFDDCSSDGVTPDGESYRSSFISDVFNEILEHDPDCDFFTVSKTTIPFLQALIKAGTRLSAGFGGSVLSGSDVNEIIGINSLILDIAENTKALSKPAGKELIPQIFAYFFGLMKHGLDDESLDESTWGNDFTPDEEVGDETELPLFYGGASAIDKLGELVHGKQIDSLVLPLLQQNVAGGDWQGLAAALGLITYCHSSMKKSFHPHMAAFMDSVVIPALHHKHPFVRFCALQCIAQLSTDDAPHFQKSFAAKILPLLCKKLRVENECPRIEEIAGGTISTFFDALDTALGDDDTEDADESAASVVRGTRYLDDKFASIFESLLQSLAAHEDTARRPNFVVYRQIRAVNDVVQVCSKRLGPFAPAILDTLQILVRKYHGSFVAATSAAKSAESERRGGGDDQKAVDGEKNGEATSVILSSLTKVDRNLYFDIECLNYAIEGATLLFSFLPPTESLRQTAIDLTSFLIDLLETGNLKPRDGLLRYVLRGLNCMSEHLRGDVVPVLPGFLRALLFYANIECDFTAAGDDTSDVDSQVSHEEHEEFGKITYVRVVAGGKHLYKIPTQLIEIKDLASTILYSLCDTIKGELFDTVPELTQCAIQLLSFSANSEVRENGGLILAGLVGVIENVNANTSHDYVSQEVIDQKLIELGQNAIPSLLENVDDETDHSITTSFVSSLRRLVAAVPASKLDDVFGSLLSKAVALRDAMFSEISTLRQDIEGEAAEADPDDDDAEEGLLERFGEGVEPLEEVLFDVAELLGVLLKKNPARVLSHDGDSNIINTAKTSVLSALELYTKHQAFLQAKKAASKSGKSGAGKGGRKAAPSGPVPKLPIGDDPKFYKTEFTDAFALVGVILENAAALISENQNYATQMRESVQLLLQVLPLLNEESQLQAAAWTVGMCVAHAGELTGSDPSSSSPLGAPNEFVVNCLRVILEIFEHPAGFELDDEYFDAALTNSFSVAVRSLKHFGDDDKALLQATSYLSSLLDRCIDALPLEGDDVEAKKVIYPILTDFLVNHPAHPLLGEKGTHREKLCEAFENMLGNDHFSAETEAELRRSIFN